MAGLAGSLSACGAEPAPQPVVLVIQDGEVPDVREVVTPGVLGVELGLEDAGLAIRVVDADDLDVGVEVERGGVAVAVVAPFTRPHDGDVDRLGEAGIAVVSLSDLIEPRATPGLVVRTLVASVATQAATVRAVAPPGPLCAAGEGSAWSEVFTEALAPVSELAGAPAAAATDAADLNCATLVWAGSADGAAALAPLMRRVAPDTMMILGSPSRTLGLATGLPLELTLAAECACVDLSSSAQEGAQAFLHAYASANGLDAGPFAAEGYDAGRLIASATRRGTTPQAIATALADLERFEGLAGTYAWGSDGDLREPPVRMYGRVGLRWLELPPSRVAPEATRE